MTPQEKEKYFKVHKRIVTEHIRENGEVFYTASVIEDGGSWLWGLIKFRASYTVNGNGNGVWLENLRGLGDEYRLTFSHFFESVQEARDAIELAIDKYIEGVRRTIVKELQHTY